MTNAKELLALFVQYANYDANLTRRNSKTSLHGFDHSELNCIQCVGTMDAPNVTAIAAEMRMTRGAVSKILHKLADKGAVTGYRQDGNRQKIFFRLTDLGQTVFAAHAERHEKWSRTELGFFDTLSAGELATAISFMRRLNDYLLTQSAQDEQ